MNAGEDEHWGLVGGMGDEGKICLRVRLRPSFQNFGLQPSRTKPNRRLRRRAAVIIGKIARAIVGQPTPQ